MKLKILPLHPYEPAHHERAKALAKKHGLTLEYQDPGMKNPDILEMVEGADLLIATPHLGADILPALPSCKLIALEFTGYDAIDVAKARAQDITVCNVPGYSTHDVAERIMSYLLTLTQRLREGEKILREGQWTEAVCTQSISLKGKTMGLLGMGRIGQEVTKMAHAFGMNVIAHTANPDDERKEKLNIEWVSFDGLLEQADVVALAAPATAQNHEIFDASAFKKMKKTAIFINAARGALVDESALAEVLKNNDIAAAGIDVYQQEPLQANHPLLEAPNTILTPHTAFASDVSLDKLHHVALDNVEAFLEGRPQNEVN